MKKIIVALCSVLMMFVLTACGGSSVATVNGENISEEYYTDYIDNLMIIYETNGYTLTNDEKANLKDSIIKELVNQECVKQAAKELECYPTEDEIEAYFDEQLAATFGDAKTGKDYIKSLGLDLEIYRSSYEVALCQEKIGATEVPENSMTEKDATAMYEKAPESFYTRTVSHILITPDAGEREVEKDEDGAAVYTDEEWDAALAKAEDLVKQLDDGAEFAKLAQENSDDTGTASAGGALGEPFTKEESQYVEEFTTASFELTKEGEYTKTPVRSSFGYHIILATGVVTENDKEEIIKNILDENLATEQGEAATSYIEDFQNNADIQYLALSESAKAAIEEEKAANEEPAADDTAADDTSEKPADSGDTAEENPEAEETPGE